MNLKKLSVALAAAAALGTSHAAVVNVAGVSWDTADFFNFTSASTLLENVVTTAGGELSGFGRITSINGNAGFCAGCELTYTFSGYLLDAAYLPNPAFSFSGGTFQFFVSAANSSFATGAGFGDGTPWLTLSGANSSGGTTGSLVGNITNFAELAGQGNGYLNVSGGLAAAYFDTNTKAGGADFFFTSEFQPIPNGSVVNGKTHIGNATISGSSQTVPEPGVLALLGLGLAGLSFSRRNKKPA